MKRTKAESIKYLLTHVEDIKPYRYAHCAIGLLAPEETRKELIEKYDGGNGSLGISFHILPEDIKETLQKATGMTEAELYYLQCDCDRIYTNDPNPTETFTHLLEGMLK